MTRQSQASRILWLSDTASEWTMLDQTLVERQHNAFFKVELGQLDMWAQYGYSSYPSDKHHGH